MSASPTFSPGSRATSSVWSPSPPSASSSPPELSRQAPLLLHRRVFFILGQYLCHFSVRSVFLAFKCVLCHIFFHDADMIVVLIGNWIFVVIVHRKIQKLIFQEIGI